MFRPMKTSNVHSEWENIKGFEGTKGEYIRLDGDTWLTAHRVREEGKRRGKRNQPDSNESLPDEMYNKIENWVRKRALSCQEEVGKYIRKELDYLHGLRSHWEEENTEIDLDALVTQSCQNLVSTATQSISALDNQRAEFEDAAHDLKNFRQSHQLSHVANYPSNQSAPWLWIAVLMIIETFVGANLLGGVSRGGVIEGWMVAVVLTLVNVFLGVVVGRLWRFTHYAWGYGWGLLKLFAYTQGVLFAAVALLWNNVAGHVRDVYVRAETSGTFEPLDAAFSTAWHTMIEHPLPWDGLQSAGLALVGIFVFFFTAYKLYAADDRFPGYGAKHRKAEALRSRYSDELHDALFELKSGRDKANAAIEEIKDRYELDRASWKAVLDRLKMVVDDYPINLRQYNKDLAYLLAAYRTANLASRTTSPPHFFGIVPTIDEDVVQAPEFSIPDPPEWGDIPKKAKGGFKQVEETYDQLLTRYQMLDRVVGDYAEETL